MSDETPAEPTMAQLLARTFDDAAESYTEEAGVRLALTVVPLLGPAIDTLLGARGTQLAIDRVHRFAEELAAEVRRQDEAKIDRSFFETEEWTDIFARALRAAQSTRDREKVRALAAIVVRSAVTETRNLDTETVLQLVADLSPALLREAMKLYRDNVAPLTVDARIRGLGIAVWKPEELFVMQRLEAAGLVTRIIDSGRLTVGSEIQFELTPIFGTVMEFIAAAEVA